MAEAAAALAAHLPTALPAYQPFASGVVRVEVPIARGPTALQWLAGQEQAWQAQEVRQARVPPMAGKLAAAAAAAAVAGGGGTPPARVPPAPLTPRPALCAPAHVLQGSSLPAPRIYFSGRHSSAPATPLSSKAEAAAQGWAAVAGARSLGAQARLMMPRRCSLWRAACEGPVAMQHW